MLEKTLQIVVFHASRERKLHGRQLARKLAEKYIKDWEYSAAFHAPDTLISKL
jgi:hypothetical protein